MAEPSFRTVGDARLPHLIPVMDIVAAGRAELAFNGRAELAFNGRAELAFNGLAFATLEVDPSLVCAVSVES